MDWIKSSITSAAASSMESAASLLEGREESNFFLEGVFAPVHGDVPFTEAAVEKGEIPQDLEGVFLRIGPNPYFSPRNGKYHVFDGDGAIHAVQIKNGKAAYARHQVDTIKLQQEKAQGRPVFPNIGDMKGLSGLLRLAAFAMRIKNGEYIPGSTANTALVIHANKLLALNEADKPYEISVTDTNIRTMGIMDEFKGHAFSAHPKVDPETQFMYSFAYDVSKKPYLTVYVFDDTGKQIRTIPFSKTFTHPQMIHDCAVTKDYMLLLDLNVCFKAEIMVTDGTMPFFFDTEKQARIGILPKNATHESDAIWIPLDVPQMIFHTVNAWQESDQVIKLVASRMDRFNISLDDLVSSDDKDRQRLVEYTLDLGKKTAKCMNLSGWSDPRSVDFGFVRRDRIGTFTPFGFASAFDVGKPLCTTGIVKADLRNCRIVSKIELDGYAGEAVFVPRASATEEDDGYLVAMLRDPNRSTLNIYDAKTMSNEPIAVISLPQVVPMGFHSNWMPSKL